MTGGRERKEINYENVDKLYQNRFNMSIAISKKNDYKGKCDPIFVAHANLSDTFHEICQTLLACMKLSEMSSIVTDPYNYCNHVNYWLNKKLREADGIYNTHDSNIFSILTSSFDEVSSGICKNHIYDLGDTVFKEINKLYTFYKQYKEILLKKNSDNDGSCAHAVQCANIYKENIVNCVNDKDKFCSELKKLKNQLLRELEPLGMCRNARSIISSIEEHMTKSSMQGQNGGSTLITTSISVLGTIIGTFFLLLFLYKVNPFSSALSPLIRKIKKNSDIINEEDNHSLGHYSYFTESNSITRGYNVPYQLAEN
ncbi:PIR protein [Plasmodium ovale]|uniref:PIR Superfamily Protein n=2 Tax=Plasmodium ovale TaxID=36330 RepID=A0A1A8WEW0_PLAOA|nr:PIR Superfamily Protein [Plasmodium ovale curtisi]SBS99062.1 PIR Superfamily Protein [Plasmodium ovale curtisi]SBT84738.1 PIR protein [Plasmodium ovale]